MIAAATTTTTIPILFVFYYNDNFIRYSDSTIYFSLFFHHLLLEAPSDILNLDRNYLIIMSSINSENGNEPLSVASRKQAAAEMRRARKEAREYPRNRLFSDSSDEVGVKYRIVSLC